MDSLLESIGEELSKEEPEELEKQWCQLEEEVEAEQLPTAPLIKQMTVTILQGFYALLHNTLDYMEEMDPDYEWLGLKRCRVLDELSCYEHLLHEKRRASMQSTLDSWVKKKNPPTLKLLPPTSLTPATSLSQGPPQAAIPFLPFRRRCSCCGHRHLM